MPYPLGYRSSKVYSLREIFLAWNSRSVFLDLHSKHSPYKDDLKTSWRRMQRYNFSSSKTSQRCLAKTSYRFVRQETFTLRFSENLAWFVFLKHPFWDLPFCLITDEFWKPATTATSVWNYTRNVIIHIACNDIVCTIVSWLHIAALNSDSRICNKYFPLIEYCNSKRCFFY